MKNIIKVGIAGFGKIGKIRYNEINKIEGATTVAIFDIETPKRVAPNIKICKDFDSLIKEDIDAVFICTYNNVLAEYTKKALLAGKHVFCEKPPARTTKELMTVIEIEGKSNKVLKYGFNHRHHYSVMEAKKIIEIGNLGKMLWLRGVYGKAGSIDYHKNWRNYREYSGGGILIDQGIHMLDLMVYFSKQDFKHMSSFVTTSFWDIEAEDNAFVIMQSDEKITGMLHSSATQWRHKFLLEMTFENGYVNIDGILSATRSYAPEKLVVGYREFEDVTFAMGKPKESTTWFENDDSWKLEVEEFFDAIRNNTPVLNGTSKDAFNTLLLVERVYEYSGFYSDNYKK